MSQNSVGKAENEMMDAIPLLLKSLFQVFSTFSNLGPK